MTRSTNAIKPTTETAVFDTNDAAIQALGNKQVDAIVVDLPTADFITNVQLDGSTIVGQLDQGQPEHFSAVLAKGSALTPCVNAAIKAIDGDGTLAKLVIKYLHVRGDPGDRPVADAAGPRSVDDPVGGGPASGSPAPSRASERPASAAQRRVAWRPLVIAAVSTVVFFVLLGLVIVNAPGWPEVKSSFFNGKVFADSWPLIVAAFVVNIQIFVIAELLVLPSRAGGRRPPEHAGTRLPADPHPGDRLRRRLPGACRAILVIFILGFGVPALGLPGLPTDPTVLRGSSRWSSSTRPTSPRSTAPASTRCTRARVPPRGRSG